MIHTHEIKGELRPLQDWVILAPVEIVKEKGGILLPDSAREYRSCRVVAVGPGRLPYHDGIYGHSIVPTELRPGQHVFIQRFVEGEMKFNLNGETVFAIRERHLSLVIDGETKKPRIGKARR